MRPPNKSRSRNKNNRRNNNNSGNSLNRVYDSSGPQGRVRGTPAQVIEKYQSLAHDSALSGDRVATENFQQHAEHYIRLMNEAQRQIAERREAQEQAQQERQQKNASGNGQDQNQGGSAKVADPGSAEQPDVSTERPTASADPMAAADGPTDETILVETPEEKKPRPPRQRRPRTTKPAEVVEQPTDDQKAAE